MKYLLDTNTIIYFLNGKFNIKDKIKKVGLSDCAISEITVAELFYGAEKSNFRDKNIETINNLIENITIIPAFDAIQIFGKEKARLSKIGQLILVSLRLK
jgi:tRNA(fMet)-specific endonuclease VapC